MNIFYTNKCPKVSAINLDSKRVNKMILESCQMLCTAINENGGESPYKSTHKNHPSNIWVRESRANFDWLYKHARALAEIYQNERNRIHGCVRVLDIIQDRGLWALIPQGSFTEPPNCAANKSLGICYKHVTDVPTAYKRYLCERWDNDKLAPKWGLRNKPEFYL